MNEMGHIAHAIMTAKHPDARVIEIKRHMIQQQIFTLHRLATYHQQRLMESTCRRKYFLESAGLEHWIQEQVQTASSEDYGQDYEHLLVSGLSILLTHKPVAVCSHSKNINTMQMDRCADSTSVT